VQTGIQSRQDWVRLVRIFCGLSVFPSSVYFQQHHRYWNGEIDRQCYKSHSPSWKAIRLRTLVVSAVEVLLLFLQFRGGRVNQGSLIL
jgi:hypothetical protein